MRGHFVDIDDVAKITDPDFRARTLDKRSPTYKILYRLKATGVLTSIRQGLYYVSMGETVDTRRLLEDRYWSIARKVLMRETGGEYFLSGNKALELALRDYSAPARLIVSTRDSLASLRLSDRYTLSLRTITSGQRLGGKNLFPSLRKHTTTMEIE